MAELDTSGGGKKGGGKVRSKKASTRVDLTAMVDLAFLLITFFILTTTLQKPKAMDLIMPDKDDTKVVQQPVAASRTMTIVLGSNNKYEWWIGEAMKTPPTLEKSYAPSVLRKLLMEKSKDILQSTGKPMFVIIQASDKSKYNNVVTIMDELNIIGNEMRAIVDIQPANVELLKRDGAY